MKLCITLIGMLMLAWLELAAQDDDSDYFYNEVIKTKPEGLDQVNFKTGYIYSTGWPELEFIVYNEPDTGSTVLFHKKSYSDTLYQGTEMYCVFENAGNIKSCTGIFLQSDPSDPPVSLSLKFSDFLFQEYLFTWYRIHIDSAAGWVKTPFSHGDDSGFFRVSRKKIHTSPYVSWLPGKDVKMHPVPGKSAYIIPGSQLEADSTLCMIVYNEIEWFKNVPYLKAALARKLQHHEWCQQLKKPDIIHTGYIRMFDKNHRINASVLPAPRCD